jgi:hypothetical protein
MTLLLKWMLIAAVHPGGSTVAMSGKRAPMASCSAPQLFGKARETTAQRSDGGGLELGWWWGKVGRGVPGWPFYRGRSLGGRGAMPYSRCRMTFGDRF